MAKKDEKTVEGDGKAIEPEPAPKEDLKTKVDDKLEEGEKKIQKATGARVNLIGELEVPEPENKAEFKDWAKKLDDKIDALILKLDGKKEEPKKEEPAPKPEPKKVSWLDRELF